MAAMEQCASVEREVDKVLQKFLTYGQHCEQSLEELLHYVGQLRAELASTVLPEDKRHRAETGFGPQGHSQQCFPSGQSH